MLLSGRLLVAIERVGCVVEDAVVWRMGRLAVVVARGGKTGDGGQVSHGPLAVAPRVEFVGRKLADDLAGVVVAGVVFAGIVVAGIALARVVFAGSVVAGVVHAGLAFAGVVLAGSVVAGVVLTGFVHDFLLDLAH